MTQQISLSATDGVSTRILEACQPLPTEASTPYMYSHPGVDRTWLLKGFLKNAVIFDPIDRIWIPRCVQPSVHSKTASSTIFYLWVWKMTFLVFKNSEILSTPEWLYMISVLGSPVPPPPNGIPPHPPPPMLEKCQQLQG